MPSPPPPPTTAPQMVQICTVTPVSVVGAPSVTDAASAATAATPTMPRRGADVGRRFSTPGVGRKYQSASEQYSCRHDPTPRLCLGLRTPRRYLLPSERRTSCGRSINSLSERARCAYSSGPRDDHLPGYCTSISNRARMHATLYAALSLVISIAICL